MIVAMRDMYTIYHRFLLSRTRVAFSLVPKLLFGNEESCGVRSVSSPTAC
jgi:hypothetical protein